MGGRVGCWRLMAVAGLAGLLPTFLSLLHPGGGRQAPRLAARPPVCLEAWVRLRSYRGCPVLAAAAGYRLEILCFWGGHLERSGGTLVFAGPFAGRAFVSSQPVPLGRWVHLAGLEGSRNSAASLAASAIAFDDRDVTAGRLTADAEPLPLGYDPWEERPSWATAAGTVARCRGPAAISGGRDPACRDAAERPDGEIGAWRLSRGWRGLAQVAAARGSPERLAPLPPSRDPAPGEPAPDGTGRGITARGWKILAAALLAALAMAGAGLVLRLRYEVRYGAPATGGGGGALRRVPMRRER